MKETIEAALLKEETDVDKYTKLAEVADKEYPDRGYGSIIRDIAKEEASHKKLLSEIIEDLT